ncbi:MAG: hypothetical protein IT457_12915 [Planctomycetes bacterium]|nr:hypothetical protein [Planctomycetota bacterium]
MNRLRPTLSPVTCVLLVACGQGLAPPANDGVLRVDGRSEASFERTLRAIKDTLDGPAQSAFAEAALTIDAHAQRGRLRSGSVDLATLQRGMREVLHGMSAAEILAEASRLGPPPR